MGPKSLLSIQLYSSTKLTSEKELEPKIRHTFKGRNPTESEGVG